VRLAAFLSILVAASLAACDDAFGPRFWDPTPDTVEIYSVSRAELFGFPSAYDIVQLRSVLVESPAATGQWDFLLAEENGEFLLVPAGAFGGIVSRAGIASVTADSLGGIDNAPSDSARFSTQPVVIRPGAFYVLRTRRETCEGGFGSGVRYGKMHALSVDAARGVFRFAIVRNPFCNDRSLIPPEDED
jgi:hypothetical protein